MLRVLADARDQLGATIVVITHDLDVVKAICDRAALLEKGVAGGAEAGPVVVTVMDRERMADYLGMAAELRAAGIRAEVYLGNPKNFGNQLKYADKRGAPVAVIQGTDEATRGVVQVKDLHLGALLATQAMSRDEWTSHPSQIEVPRSEIVKAVKGIKRNIDSRAEQLVRLENR